MRVTLLIFTWLKREQHLMKLRSRHRYSAQKSDQSLTLQEKRNPFQIPDDRAEFVGGVLGNAVPEPAINKTLPVCSTAA
jgi:hypothetical protein